MHVILPPLMRSRAAGIWEISLPEGKQAEVHACVASMESEGLKLFEAGARITALTHWAMAELPTDLLEVGSSNERVDQAIEHLHLNFPESIPNDDLAAQVGMNTNAFIRLFRQTMGETPQHYYTRLRIDQACQMLHGGEASIDHIAEATGFCDRYHFSRVFKKLRGMGPASFRKLREAFVA